MGFLEPNLPSVDYPTWSRLSRSERMKPMARHFAQYGFGSPDVLIVVYALKIVAYLAVGWGLVMTKPGIDGPFDVLGWGSAPQVLYTFALWTMLFEVLGLGGGFGPLNLRINPPLGTFLYWLRPRTIRLPPFPRWVPLTAGDERTPVDCVLYAGFLVSMVIAMVGQIHDWQVVSALVFLALIGLRDKAIFLAARSEVYAPMLVAMLFAPIDGVASVKLTLLLIWFGAAISKVNQHFAFVVSAMFSNSPVFRLAPGLKKRLHTHFPDDLRPSPIAHRLAHVGSVVEFGVPLVLLFAGLYGPHWLVLVAAVCVSLFHLNIITSLPMGVPLEWNVFMIIGVWVMFVGQADAGFGSLEQPLLVIGLFAVSLFFVVFGNVRPDKVSFLPSMRYYAGNWAATAWCFRGDALDRFESSVVKASKMPHVQLEELYGSKEEAMIPLHLGYAFRGFHTHGRALYTLAERVCLPEAPDDPYLLLDGELVTGTAVGWNFGDGHMQHEQIAAALHKRCDFRPGDVRVVFLESQPMLTPRQQYRLFDPAVGELERGYVEVADLVSRQPTDFDVPLHVESTTLD
ncbi:DUF3556 domain-containing protein [Nocardioides acrostichi]|uniref:DUF3556 domain-containing protein n=1 Tax=Nocardioides acrostichi TaxID=2784339 RepID=A0A930V0T5_9ACTN|nr:DUF3556 domain-containing protein [Nocardioides acrostichi]MBF4161625.1 DUF3556 domain-containing protein [Nocardioides acrostichi]